MSTVTHSAERVSSAGPAAQAHSSRIAGRLQKLLVFEIVVLLANLYGAFVMIGVTYAMATEDGFTGVNLYFGYLSDLSVVAVLIASEVLTLLVAVRTWRMLSAATKGDLATLRRFSSAGWATIAIFSSYIVTGIVLLGVNREIRALETEES